MKIIDLLNKIANGEEVPEKVVDITRGIFIESTEEYDLYNKLYEEDIYINDEIEILGEGKKIPEKLDEYEYDTANEILIIRKINEIIDYLKSKGE